MISRRVFVVGAVALGTAGAARAQRPSRVAYLAVRTGDSFRLDAFRRGLLERGYEEGRNIVLEYYWADDTTQFTALADAIAASAPDVVVAINSPAALAIKARSASIPIVIAGVSDPLASASSRASPVPRRM